MNGALARERTLICGAIVASILGVLVISGLTLAYLQRQAEARIAATTQNLAKSLVQTFDGLLDAIDVAILASADEIARQGAGGHPDQQQINRYLLTQQERLPVVPYLRGANAQGEVVHGAGLQAPYISVLGRPYFTALRERPPAGLYISPPGIGRLSQKWVWQFSRRISNPDGSFGGIVYGVLAIDQIRRIMTEINLDAGGSIVLRHAGFEAVAARMGSAAGFGLTIGDTTLSPELRAALGRDAQRGTYSTSAAAQAATEQTFSYERSAKYGFYVWVGEAKQAAMAEWQRQVGVIAGLAFAFALLAGGFLWLMRRGWRRQERDLQAIRHLAYYDALTALPNRRLLLEQLGAAMTANGAQRRYGALLLIDLDNFKILNDTQGHGRGDLLLRAVAQRLQDCVGGRDSVARLGGDEFALLCADVSDDAGQARLHAARVGEQVRGALCQPFDLDGYHYAGSPSVGITLFAGHELTIDELIKRADTAMYQAKAAGRNAARFFDPEMQAAVAARLAMERELRVALAEGQFVLHYQAQVNAGARVTGAEVLVRWQHPERGMVAPAQFIGLAEASGLILPLGHWVLESACLQLAAWARDPDAGALTLAVNVSACQFNQADFVGQVLSVLERTGADPRLLKLELTEGSLLENTDAMGATMSALKRAGVGFSLDDFGTGYSSLSYLKRLPLDQLKIDQSFVRDLLTDACDVAIVRAIVALGHSLGLDVIAEGVETPAQRDYLAAAGCHAYQGYLFGRPLALAEFELALRRRAPACIPA